MQDLLQVLIESRDSGQRAGTSAQSRTPGLFVARRADRPNGYLDFLPLGHADITIEFDGPVWKWMALEGGVLFALVGEKDPPGDALKGPGFHGGG